MTPDELAAIKARLDVISQGDWVFGYYPNTPLEVHSITQSGHTLLGQMPTIDDAMFVANAPEDMRRLMAHILALDACYRQEHDAAAQSHQEATALLKRATDTEADNTRLRAVADAARDMVRHYYAAEVRGFTEDIDAACDILEDALAELGG